MLKYFVIQIKFLKILSYDLYKRKPSLFKLIFTPIFFLTLSLTITVQSCDILDPDDKYEPPTIEINYPPIDQYPAWSPDGNKIMYHHLGITKINSDGTYIINPDSAGLWIINSEGTNPRLLLQGINTYADWSPNGDWILFEQGGQICKAPFINDSIDKAQITQLTFEGRNFFPSWSPDGQWIAYDSNVDSPNGMNFIWKMKSDGTQKTRIAYDPVKGEIRMPSWSKVIDKILHVRYSTDFRNAEIFEMSSLGNDPIRLTNNTSRERYPKYSPDGDNIVFQSQVEGEIPQIWIINADGSNQVKITNDGGEMPYWSSSGKIVYVSYDYRKWQEIDRSNGTVWIMNPDGSNKQQLTFGPSP